MKPFKVWNADRSKKVMVVAKSMEELMRKGNVKLGLNSVVDDLKIVLEEDGTEVDQDYLPFVKANTILMLLSTSEQWNERKGSVAVNRSTHEEHVSEATKRKPTQYILSSNLTLGPPVLDDSTTLATKSTIDKHNQ